MYDALFDFCFNHTYFLLLASGIDTNAYISPKNDSQKTLHFQSAENLNVAQEYHWLSSLICRD